MFEETVKLLAKWKEQGLPQCLISINASALHAQNSDTIHRYTTIIQKYGVDPSLTELELTETATVSDYDHVNSCLQSFRQPVSGQLWMILAQVILY